MNDPIDTVRLKHDMNGVKNYLLAAQDVVKSGHMPDLGGLEDRIALICEAIKKVEPDIQKEFIIELNDLLGHLNACENAMRESQTAIKTGNAS